MWRAPARGLPRALTARLLAVVLVIVVVLAIAVVLVMVVVLAIAVVLAIVVVLAVLIVFSVVMAGVLVGVLAVVTVVVWLVPGILGVGVKGADVSGGETKIRKQCYYTFVGRWVGVRKRLARWLSW